MSFSFTGDPIEKWNLIPTPFSESAGKAIEKGTLSLWGPFALAECYSGIEDELHALRNGAMIEDKSPLINTHISGPDAEAFVSRLIPRDATSIEINHAYYTPWCDDNGKVIVEGLLFRLSPTDFILTANEMRAWFEQNSAGFDVAFHDLTRKFEILAFQGPKSMEIMEDVTGENWGDLRFSRGRGSKIAGADIFVWRTGFTGLKGYELWVPPSAGNAVWDALMDAGYDRGLRPCGHAAQDIARVEAGFVLPAIDYARAGPDAANLAHGFGLREERFLASPFELNLGRLVDFSKGDFVGRKALLADSRATSGRRQMMGLEIDWQQIVRSCLDQGIFPVLPEKVRRFPPLDLLEGDGIVGFCTCPTWSGRLGKLIALAQVPMEKAREGTVYSLDWPMAETTIRTKGKLVEFPFVKPSRAN